MGVSSRIAALFALLMLTAFPAGAEQRLALVIGNNDYPSLAANEQLQRAVNDANAVGDALQSLGFDVTRGENLSRGAMLAALFATTARLERGDFAFFFFAGHGVSIDGANYLLPADIPAAGGGGERLIQESAVSEATIVQQLRARGVRVAMVVLDACRNNPFSQGGTRSFGDAARGLARPPTVETQGVFGLYSAGFGEEALDRLGEEDDDANSVFTRVLVPELRKPGQSLIDVAYAVNEGVAQLARTVGHDQNPAYYDQARARDVFLAGGGSAPRPEENEPETEVVGTSCGSARLHFDAARGSNRADALRDHVARFGHCEFASLARIMIEQMEGEEVAAVTPDTAGRSPTATQQGGSPSLDAHGTANAFVRALTGGTPVLDGGTTNGTPFHLTFASARNDGADILIEGLSIRESETSRESLVFAEAVITAPAATAEGNLTSPRIELRNGTFEQQGFGEGQPPTHLGSLESFAIEDFTTVTRLMSGPGASAFGYVFGAMEAQNLQLLDRDVAMVTVARASLEAKGFVGGQPRDTAGHVEGISIAKAVFGGEKVIELLRYDPFVLQVSWKASRDFAGSSYALNDLTVELEGGGVLKGSGVARQVPPLSLLLQALATQDALRLLSIELQSLSLRYDDASFAGRVLDALVVRNLKQSRAELIQEAIYTLQRDLMLDPVFELRTAPVLADFMLEPRSFGVEVAPATPLTITKIGEILASAPETLHQALGVSFSVNAAQ